MAGGLGAWPAVASNGTVARLCGLLGVAAALTLAAGLATRLAPLVPAAVVLLGAGYAAHLVLDDVALDQGSAAFAAGLLATAELAYWSLELRSSVPDEAGGYLRRIAYVAVLSLGTLALGAALLAAVELGSGGGVGLDLLGALGAVAALGVVAALSARGSHTDDL